MSLIYIALFPYTHNLSITGQPLKEEIIRLFSEIEAKVVTGRLVVNEVNPF